MLRITNGMMVNSLKRNMNSNMLNMSDIQLQLSTGKKINKPSDDPAGIVKALRLRTNLNESAQYRTNINEAASFLQTTDDALNMVNEIIQKIRELTVKAATGTNDSDAQQANAKEITELNEQLKLVANSTYGSKYLFSGTNVTEAPYQGNNWLGNEELMQLEIGVGVTIPINLKMKDYFMGRLDSLYINPSSDGIQGLEARDLQEGKYTINTQVSTLGGVSTASEAQSYLSSISNNGHFFYKKDIATGAISAAALGAGAAAGASNSGYNTSLMVEVKQVQAIYPPGTPRASLAGTSTVPAPILNFDQAMYMRDANDALVAMPANVTANFTYIGSGTMTATYAANAVTFAVTGAPAEGDTIIWNNDVDGAGKSKAYGADGKEYTPVKMVFKGGQWTYDDTARVTVDIKGHVYDANGVYTYVERKDLTINMEAGSNQELFTISAAPLSGEKGTLTAPIVIWNNSGTALAGIDPRNPQIQVGDKTVISTAAVGAANAEMVDIGYTYLDRYGNKMAEKEHNFAFADGFFDNDSKDLKFFTLNEQTGLSYSGNINVACNDFVAKTPSSFDYKAGLFAFVDDLARKVTIGKLPQVGNELAGNDSRLQDLLLYRSTIGARINRLELQTNRLINTEETYTTLLSYVEDANEAEVIMNLKLQENVYNASLAAGARIIQPTLMDFLR